MPIVRIDYEKEHVSEDNVRKLVQAIQISAADVTGYDPEEISVFASANQITANAAPLEIYIYATFPDVSEDDMESMLEKLSFLILDFKKENDIKIPFNLSVVKMNWKFKIAV